eukprot:Gb_31784 [translate_table: standard]
MGRWKTTISFIWRRKSTSFRLSSFPLDCSPPYSLDHNLHPRYGSCFTGKPSFGIHSANRGRGKGRDCGSQMWISFDTSLSLSSPRPLGTHHCFSCIDVQAAHSLSNPAAQNCKNLWQEKMWVWSLNPALGIPYRKVVSRAASFAPKSISGAPEMNLDEYNSDSEEEEDGDSDSDDAKTEQNRQNNLETYEHSGQPVDFREVERVHKVVEELFASDRNMEAVLDQCGVNLSHSLVYHVLNRFCNARKPAFRFFIWAGQQVGFSHNSRTYNMMMSILGRTKQFVTMCELLDEMGKKGSVLTIETFEIAIKAFAAAREMKKAVHMFDLMEKYNFNTDIDTFNLLLDALGRAKLAKEAQMVFERMRERFPPDVKTYTVLLSGWCKVKNLTQAGKLWNDMVDIGLKPDLITYNIMLEGIFKGRRMNEALKFFDLMKTNGPSPNTRSYTIVIRALSKAQMMEEALKFFEEMQENGCLPDAAVYTCLMTGFGTTKKLDHAYGLLKEMKERGCPHDSRAYNALIKVTIILKRPDEATYLYNKMTESGFEPTIHTYNMLMKLYFRFGKSEMGFAIWNEMVKMGCCPDVNSYTVFIGGLIKEGRSQEACTYLESMIDKGMKAPRFDYNKFLADFSRAGRPNIFEELAEKMKHTGKLDISDVFLRFSTKMKNRVKRRRASSK